MIGRKFFFSCLALSIPVAMISCNDNGNQEGTEGSNADSTAKQTTYSVPDSATFNSTIDGKRTSLYVLKNSSGMMAAITNYGGRLVSLIVPSKTGQPVDVVVGFPTAEGFAKSTEPYFGATIGRYGNRIAKGKFNLEGKTYTLFTNNGPNTLHGGKKGFQDVVWDAQQSSDSVLVLSYLSKDMEEGFPGNLNVTVTYTLTADNGLKIDYAATTDKSTVINLTNHAFYNLNGAGSGTILNHIMQINADKYIPVDSTLIPMGNIASVQGTPFDFRNPTRIGARIDSADQQLKFGLGYDHNYVLSEVKAQNMLHAATVIGDQSGVKMDVYTQEPGLQFYSGNFMQSKNDLRGGFKDDFRTAFCLETQHFPDSPNQPTFPSTVLKPGNKYQTTSIYKFSVTQ